MPRAPEATDAGAAPAELTVEEVERRAAAVLAAVPEWIWDGERLPVPIEDIADSHYGLLVRDVADLGAAPGAPELTSGQSLSGLLLPARGEIWVNAEERELWPRRCRFTISHELGHWEMHRPGQQALFCRSAAVRPEDSAPPTAELPPIETEANAFAAALMMPAHLVREQYARLEGDGDRHRRLCELFSASEKAMGRRLHAVV